MMIIPTKRVEWITTVDLITVATGVNGRASVTTAGTCRISLLRSAVPAAFIARMHLWQICNAPFFNVAAPFLPFIALFLFQALAGTSRNKYHEVVAVLSS